MFCAEVDPDLENNSATATLTVGAASDLAVDEKPSALQPGEAGHTIVVIENKGAGGAANVELTATIPAGLSDLEATPSEGACNFAARRLTCGFGTLSGGETVRVVISEKVDIEDAGKRLIFDATVTSSERDAHPADNHARLSQHVGPAAELSVHQQTAQREVAGGGLVHYVIVVRSTGPVVALDVQVCDRLPGDQVYRMAGGAVFRAGEACWTIPRLAPGKTRRFDVTTAAAHAPASHLSTSIVRATATNALARTALAHVRITRSPARAGGATG
jgi:uncharacterized repeat protein (TIGR01451 family)